MRDSGFHLLILVCCAVILFLFILFEIYLFFFLFGRLFCFVSLFAILKAPQRKLIVLG